MGTAGDDLTANYQSTGTFEVTVVFTEKYGFKAM
jgi:hypothetical protein